MKQKILLYSLLLPLTGVLTGCGEINDDDLIISGTIESYTYVSDREVRLCSIPESIMIPYTPIVFGAADIRTDGSFKMIPSAPESSLLVPLDSIFGLDIIKSDLTAKGLKAILKVYNSHYQTYIGGVTKSNSEVMYCPGSVIVRYIYVDKDVSVSGTGTMVHNEGRFAKIRNTYNCNLSLKAGWNQYIEESVACTYYSTVIEASSIEPVGLKWYFEKH